MYEALKVFIGWTLIDNNDTHYIISEVDLYGEDIVYTVEYENKQFRAEDIKCLKK